MIEIRYAQVSDAKALGEIHSLSWREAYKGIVPDGILEAFTPEKRGTAFEWFLTVRSSHMAVALADGEAAGWACFDKCRDEDAPASRGEVWGIYLNPAFWRKGAGSALLLWTLEELKKMGYTSASLWVLEDNARARAFYEKCGFIHDGARKTIELGKKLKEVRYTKEI